MESSVIEETFSHDIVLLGIGPAGPVDVNDHGERKYEADDEDSENGLARLEPTDVGDTE